MALQKYNIFYLFCVYLYLLALLYQVLLFFMLAYSGCLSKDSSYICVLLNGEARSQ